MLTLHQDINYNKYYLKYKLNVTFNNKNNWVNRVENFVPRALAKPVGILVKPLPWHLCQSLFSRFKPRMLAFSFEVKAFTSKRGHF